MISLLGALNQDVPSPAPSRPNTYRSSTGGVTTGGGEKGTEVNVAMENTNSTNEHESTLSVSEVKEVNGTISVNVTEELNHETSNNGQSQSQVSSSRNSRTSGPPSTTPSASHTARRSNQTSMHESMNYVLSSKGEEMKAKLLNLYKITSTNSLEDFLSVYKNSQRLFESMKSHQILAESRLSQLRGEFNELQGSLGETIYVQNEIESQDDNKTASSSEREMRYMDQRTFQAEMRMNQNVRRTEKSVLNINEVRTGVVHIAQLLSVNESLLQNLPSSTPPVMKSESGIAKMLAWCEERVLAINEALVLDASKPNQMDDSKPLCDRQTDLAQLIQALLSRGNPSSARYKNRLKVVKNGSISKDILGQLDGGESLHEYDEDSTAIRIHTDSQVEEQYSEKVDEALRVLEARAIMEENAASNNVYDDRTEQMLQLLNKAVVSQDSKTALRRANKLANRKQGRRAGFGWTIEELLRADADIDQNEAKNNKVMKNITETHNTDIVERVDIKTQSRSVLRSHKLQQQQSEEENILSNSVSVKPGNGSNATNNTPSGGEGKSGAGATKEEDDKAS